MPRGHRTNRFPILQLPDLRPFEPGKTICEIASSALCSQILGFAAQVFTVFALYSG